MIGLLMVNVVHPTVQPYGGASRVLGSNPISIAAPTEASMPLLVDFATSAVAEGKVGLAAMNGKKIPLGWIVDSDGRDTDDPLDFSLPNGSVDESRESGRLLSFGGRDGHKGYALALLMEILAGILPGGGSIADEEGHLYENGLLAIVLNIQDFTPTATFRNRVHSLIKKMHSEPVQAGFEHDQVQVPGEFESKNREKRMKEGIDVAELKWKEILSLAEELKIQARDEH
jgi:uncharacterized oxidoreductase